MPLSAHTKHARPCFPRTSTANPRCGRGFTLIELLLIVAIVAVLAAIALPSYAKYQERVQTTKVILEIGSIASLIERHALDNRVHPASLADVSADNMKDPWGNPYQYVSHDDKKGKGKWRKDHNIVPINSDFDLWSNGKDGNSSPPLTAKGSRDDIVRANNGRFVGPAAEFDP